MFKYIIFSAISFMFGLFARECIELIEKRKNRNKVLPLSEQNFEVAMKNLEIK